MNDNLLVRNELATLKSLENKESNLKVEINLEDTLYCNVHFLKSGNTALLKQY